MNRRGQAAAFDMVLALLAFTVSVAVIGSFLGGHSLKTQTAVARDDYTQSLLVSMLQCTVDSEGYAGMTLSDLTAAYFRNQSLNSTLTQELTEHITPYAEERGLEWVVYANGTALLWVPYGRVLAGGEISSAETRLPTSNNESVALYLFMRWD